MSFLQVNKLRVEFAESVIAVDNVSFALKKGEILGIVGESGSGKSTLARTILKLQNKTAGEVCWKGKYIDLFDKKEKLEYRKQVQMIFQDPLDALNPRMTVAQIVAEPLHY
jgi:ABC-type glutathione transport system ATPase component